MLHTLKLRLYFSVARYFSFWASIVLNRWKPRVVVITGSSGKTTLLNLVEAQLGDSAVYSHHANSAIGIPFHVLGLPTNVSKRTDWVLFALRAPFCVFRKVPTQKLYIVEADCDRPNEGKFLAQFLRPEVTIWVSVYRTHGMNFDGAVRSGRFASQDEAIAYEFGHYIAAAQKLVILNGDQPGQLAQLKRVRQGVDILQVHDSDVKTYEIVDNRTRFVLNGQETVLPHLYPRATGMAVGMVQGLLKYLGSEQRPYDALVLPPGRSSVFAGKNGTTLIDSTYNTGLDAAGQMVGLLNVYPAKQKWLVVSDILEQGSVEREEHEKLAEVIRQAVVQTVVLVGKRTNTITAPLLANSKTLVQSFVNAGEALKYMQQNLKGGEVVLFKGAQGLEGIIEQLLDNPTDASKLVRRGEASSKKRRDWGLPA